MTEERKRCVPFEGALAVTGAGNIVYRLVKRVDYMEEWARMHGSDVWHAVILFDASNVTAVSKPSTTDTKNLFVFDALQMGLLWCQVQGLIGEVRSGLVSSG